MTPKKKVDYAVAVSSAGASVFAIAKAYTRPEPRERYAWGGFGVVAACLSVFSLLFTDDGLDRITDDSGRVWAIIPPGESYRDSEGVVFHNGTDAFDSRDIFLVLESSKGVPAWFWSRERSILGRHTRTPFFLQMSVVAPETLVVNGQVLKDLDMSKISHAELAKRLQVYVATSRPEKTGVLLMHGEQAPSPFDKQQYYYREYDTVG